MNIVETLKNLGVEIPAEAEKKIGGEWVSVAESEKKLRKAESEIQALTERAESAENTLKGFEGKDFDAIQKDRDEWKSKFEQAQKDYQKKLADDEREKLIDEHIAGLQFSSEYAKRAYRADLIKEELKVSNGKLMGARDFQEAYSKDAFIDVEAQAKQQKAEATRSSIVGASVNNQTKTMTKEDIRAIKDPEERQKAMMANAHLYASYMK